MKRELEASTCPLYLYYCSCMSWHSDPVVQAEVSTTDARLVQHDQQTIITDGMKRDTIVHTYRSIHNGTNVHLAKVPTTVQDLVLLFIV